MGRYKDVACFNSFRGCVSQADASDQSEDTKTSRRRFWRTLVLAPPCAAHLDAVADPCARLSVPEPLEGPNVFLRRDFCG